jgi:uncharacterized protein (UPF0276 family)
VNRIGFPAIGYGVGLRRQHYSEVLESRPRVDWFEVVTENFMVEGGRPLEVLERVRRDYPIVMHGVSLSIGSVDPVRHDYLARLKQLARTFEPAWISDHLCWTGVGGRNLHDLMPLPYTEEIANYVAARIREVQDHLGRRILIENISSYMTFSQSRLSECEFLSMVAEDADCGILLDINNVFVNAFNHGFDPYQYIDSVPPHRIVQFHLAGHRDCGAYLLDSHDHPVVEPVWRLYEHAVKRFGPIPALIEWDDDIPAFCELKHIADEARSRAETALAERLGEPISCR